MPLQMASGKLFQSGTARVNQLRGILYSNLYLVEPVQTQAGTLIPTHDSTGRTFVYELQEHMEGPEGAGAMVSRGIRPYLGEFAVIVAFGRNAVCTPDVDLQRRLLVGPPSPATAVLPSKFASRTFSERTVCAGPEADRFVEFVDRLIGLRRKVFLDVMRAIRTYVTGMYRLGDDPDIAYTLLLSSVEPLLRHFDAGEPTWKDYPENKRRPIDRALRSADNRTRRDVQNALLDLDKSAIGRRFRLFVDAHVKPTFFRGEASETVSPVGRSELKRCLDHAYAMRSGYLHQSKRLPKELTLVPRSGAETVRVVGKGTVLTFEGLSRLVRHVIRQFVTHQETVEREPYDYSSEEPGVMQVELAPQYWIGQPGAFTAKDGRKRLFAFCGQLAAGMEGTGPAKISDMRKVIEEALRRLPGMRPVARLPFLVLHRLYGQAAPERCGVEEGANLARRYKGEMEVPSVEAALLALMEGTVPSWPLTQHECVLRAYLGGKDRGAGVRLHEILEIGLTLELAERYRVTGDAKKALCCVKLALENAPGNEALTRLERELQAAEEIRWQIVMGLPVRGTDDGDGGGPSREGGSGSGSEPSR